MQNNLYIERISRKPDIEVDCANYPFCIPVIRNFRELCLSHPVTFIIGENGSGKSTMLEAIAVALGFNAEGGSRNFNFRTNETHSDLHNYLRISRSYKRNKDGFFLRAESFYNMATEVENLYGGSMPSPYGDKSLHAQSHGEGFMSLMVNRFSGEGLYLLDEPEAALSPSRQMTMLVQMKQLVDLDSQFIIATHSPILLAYPQAEIYEIRDGEFVRVEYEDTEHYRLTKYFLDNPDRMLAELFKETQE